MRSLRARLILGFALVAVVPLAIAILVFSRRVETMVRQDARERLSAALGTLERDLAADAARIQSQVRLVARDPATRRLYLVGSGGRELADHLAERRSLLRLDFLQISGPSGALVADDFSSAALAGERVARVRAPRIAAGPVTVLRLDEPPELALLATAPITYEGRTTGLLRGGILLDAAYLERLKRTAGVEMLLHDPAGAAGAMTLDRADSAVDLSRNGIARVAVGGLPYWSRSVPIEIGPPPHARVTGFVPTAASDAAITTLQTGSAILAAIGLAVAVMLGSIWSSQVSRPVERLAAYSRKLAQGDWDEPLAIRSVRELETLVEALDRMRRDLAAYREKLVVSERQAAWSQMARKVAHEIKNPLTPIAISVADLKRSYEQNRADFPQILDQAVRTIGEEVESLKRILHEFSELGRMPPPRFATCRAADILADVEALYRREVAEGRLLIPPPARDAAFCADGGQIRQALVNLIQNGLESLNGAGSVRVAGEAEADAVRFSVSDTGPGLTDDQRAHLFVPGFTTKPRGSGLGLSIVERIVSDNGGTIHVDSAPGRGTTFLLRFPREPAA